jgi:uncharacterized protein
MKAFSTTAIIALALSVGLWAQTPQTSSAETEQQVSFASASARIAGTLTLPRAQARKAAVIILVPSTGFPGQEQAKREEQFYVNLAQRLAAAGIASLRYQRQSYPGAESLRVQLDDAAAAARYAATRPELNPNAEFVLGHDIAARLVPLVARDYRLTRGMILMAADLLPIEQIMAARKRRQLEQQGRPEQEIRQELASQNQIFADIRAGKTPGDRMINGGPAKDWLEWMNQNPLEVVRGSSVPVLVLQGGRDREVSEEAYEKLRSALNARGNSAEFRWFEKLDHSFGQVQLADPSKPAPIDQGAINALVTWINAKTPRSSAPMQAQPRGE